MPPRDAGALPSRDAPRWRGRFAPTPSGALHLGGARTAYLSWLSARSRGGSFVLRIEDLDHTRTRAGATQALLDDLRWLGLDWDEGPDTPEGPCAPYMQSERTALYEGALALLRAKGAAYPCVCSRREVEEATRAPHGVEPVYPGTCRGRDPDEVLAECRAKKRSPVWRFACPDETVQIEDRLAGVFTQDLARDVGDFVLYRADGVPAYQLAVVVDDVLMGCNDVVRGDDLLASAPRQLVLARALGAQGFHPSFAHVALVTGDDGVRLAKRHGAVSVRDLRERGADATRIAHALLASLGCSVASGAASPLKRALAGFDEARVPRGPVALAGLSEAIPEVRA